ncbi:uncharacterized protein LOC113294168 [Papaver somniferum]|uniref:uncharacterized protein LOC113294168 n=1 Tax=Papaver somniferum TaxID=3469 RepID=UPI000E70408B|nr:uncharacterized protein LOC113294168 [Papaver somniferum]
MSIADKNLDHKVFEIGHRNQTDRESKRLRDGERFPSKKKTERDRETEKNSEEPDREEKIDETEKIRSAFENIEEHDLYCFGYKDGTNGEAFMVEVRKSPRLNKQDNNRVNKPDMRPIGLDFVHEEQVISTQASVADNHVP